MAYTTKRFHEANPRLAAALIAAIDEANARIARDKPAAARFYRDLAKVKSSDAELLRILEDPDAVYASAPNGVMTYADFMHRVRTLRNRPAAWEELFVPEIHGRHGS